MSQTLTLTPVRRPATVQNLLRRSGLLGPRVILPSLLFWATMLMFTGQRLILFLTTLDRFHGVPAGTIVKSFAVGLRFDAAIACMLALPLLAATAAASPNLLAKRSFRWIVSAYGGLAAALVLFTCVADICFFQEFGLRLNYQALEYTQYAAVYRIVWEQYPVIWFALATLAILAAATWSLNCWGLARQPRSPWWQAIWPLLLIPIAVVGIRGGLRNRPMNSSAAYINDSPTVVQLTLNGCYTLRDAVYKFANDTELAEFYPLLKDDEALARARQILAQPNDRFFDDADNPLRRLTDSGRPRNDYNVALVVLESMSWHYIGALGEHCFFGSCVLDRPAGSGLALVRSAANDLMPVSGIWTSGPWP